MNLLLWVAILAADEPFRTVVVPDQFTVIDGDTISVSVKDWPEPFSSISVRIYGIDTPEIHTKDAKEKAKGFEAKSALERIVVGKKISILHIRRDKYFRLLADVNVDGKDVAKEMIAGGFARPYFGEKKEPWVFRTTEAARDAQSATSKSIIITSQDGSVQILPPLDPATDSKPALQSAIDWCDSHAGRESLLVPPGVWKIGTSLDIAGNIDYQCDGVKIVPMDPATFSGPLLVAGAATWPGWGTRSQPADDVSMTGLELEQSAATSANSHGMFVVAGDRWRLTRVKVTKTKHEGIVSGGQTRDWIWKECVAEDCGAGDQYRQQSGAGLNANGIGHTLIDCVTRRCGQGYEHGGIRFTFIRCKALDGDTAAGPCWGFNLGNSGIGLHYTRLIDCESSGHPIAVSIQNSIGRVGGVLVDKFTSTEGQIVFQGGVANNNVPTPDQGPADEISIIRCSKVSYASPQGYVAFNYNSSWDANPIYGKSPVDFIDCEAIIPTGEPDWMPFAPFMVQGAVTAEVHFIRPVVRGPRGPGKNQGDFHLGPLNANQLPPKMPNIHVEGGIGYLADGKARWFVETRESPK